MSSRYNLSEIEAIFRNYLHAENVSGITLKNYCSDLRFFLSWIQYHHHIQSIEPSQFSLLFTVGTVQIYQEYLNSVTIAASSKKRRLSSLRKFISCCISQKWLSNNPFHDMSSLKEKAELQTLLSEYRTYLQSSRSKIMNIEEQINVIEHFFLNY